MEEDKFYLISSQRYYHMILVRHSETLELEKFWSGIGFDRVNDPTYHKEYQLSEYRIEQKRVLSPIDYHRENSEKYKIVQSGKNFFQYDVFAIQMLDKNLSLFGFPFVSMAIDGLSSLNSSTNILKNNNRFVKPTLLNFMSSAEISKKLVSSNCDGKISGITVSVEEKSTTKLRLESENVIDSWMYREFLEPRLGDAGVNIHRISVSLELRGTDLTPQTKSTIHMDQFGNFRMYTHSSGNNIFTIPFLLLTLDENRYLDIAHTDPLKLKQEDTIENETI